MIEAEKETRPPCADRIKDLVADLTFSRQMVRSFFDTWVVQSGTLANCPGFLYAVASGVDTQAVPGADPVRDRDALALALVALPDKASVLAFMAGAISAGLFDPPDAKPEAREKARDALMARTVDCVGQGAVESILPQAVAQNAPHAETEAYDPTVVWIDPGHLLPAIIQARRRLCKIVRKDRFGNDQPLGTGFLIGPSSVMTNQHVVEALGTGPVTTRKLICRFDYSETFGLKDAINAEHLAADDWQIASSPLGAKQPQGAQVGWWAADATRNAFLETVKDSLDYAVIRLETSPGLQRGWYDLEALTGGLPAHAIALHHPGGLDQTISMGNMDFSFPGDVRLFHQASTDGGSSGGLLMNQNGAPIGLHHMGISYDEHGKRRFVNVAISLDHIAKDLKKKGAFDAIQKSAQIAPPLGCVDGVHPVFGRKDLMNKLQQMWDDPQKRILMVHFKDEDGAVLKPGKSFTVEIIKGLFRAPEHKHIVFRAGEAEADALSFVSETIDSFASDLIPELPSSSETTTPAYVQELVRFFVAKMRERLPNRAVWLIIDDLEHHRISDASGREFLATLYDQVEQIPGLRVVLIGLSRDIQLSGLNAANVLHSDIGEPDLSNFDRLFADWFRQRSAMGRPVDDIAIRLLSRTMGSYARQQAPLEVMSEFVVNHMSGVAEQLFDGGDDE